MYRQRTSFRARFNKPVRSHDGGSLVDGSPSSTSPAGRPADFRRCASSDTPSDRPAHALMARTNASRHVDKSSLVSAWMNNGSSSSALALMDKQNAFPNRFNSTVSTNVLEVRRNYGERNEKRGKPRLSLTAVPNVRKCNPLYLALDLGTLPFRIR
jgi:hypothetical protein